MGKMIKPDKDFYATSDQNVLNDVLFRNCDLFANCINNLDSRLTKSGSKTDSKFFWFGLAVFGLTWASIELYAKVETLEGKLLATDISKDFEEEKGE